MAYTIVPMASDGSIANPNVLDALAAQAAAVSDIFIFCHGWWTSAAQAQEQYTRFTDGVAACFQRRWDILAIPARNQILPIGVHWPSMVSDHPGVFTNLFEAFSYDDMRALAERVARSGLCALLQRAWRQATAAHPMRLHVLGHSMGCRIACLGLHTAILSDSRPTDPTDLATAPWSQIQPHVRIDVVLFQGAIDDDMLEPIEPYGILSTTPGVRILVTRSDQDKVLKDYPPDDGKHGAMGAAGPTPATFTDAASRFNGGAGNVVVGAGATYQVVSAVPQDFVVANLTPLHDAHGNGRNNEWAGLSGHHSDIYCDEVYELVTGFVYHPMPHPQ
ncbi:MAG TPA: hypothetical protein VEZ44_07315 [bacterium]|nr:hypothetical protein [bacterium]